jgi:NADP-dependent 3-hydroxy acid dehydrogenase YdfG
MTVEGKVIVLTGAASGMGLATARLLGSKGAKLSLADVQEGPLNEVAEDINKAGGAAIATVVDVRDRKAVEAWIQKTVSTYGKLDGAANLAGVIGKQNNMAPIQDIDDDDWDFGEVCVT